MKNNHSYDKLKKTSAQKIKGFLLFSGNTPFFRVYKDDGTFKDYQIRHSDLEVEITADCDATFYEDETGEKMILDHTPQTLGIKE